MIGMSKVQYNALDVGKFLCALLVLFYHYFSEHGPVPRLLDEVLSLYAVAVALFMVISGFLTFSKIDGMTDRKERWKYVSKQVKRIYTIYLLWSIPYILYSVSRWSLNDLTIEYVLWQFQTWIFNSTFYTIWFMPSLAIGLLVAFFVTEKIPKVIQCVLAVCLYAFGSLMLTYSFIGRMLPGYDVISAFSLTWLGGPRGWLFFGFPLIMLGKFAVRFKNQMKPGSCFLLSCISVIAMLAEALILRNFVGHTGIDMTVMMIPSTFFILGFLISFKIPNGKYWVWMRKMSVLIFMTQRFFLTVIPSLLPEDVTNVAFSNVWVGSVFVCGGTVLFSAIIILCSKKIKWMTYLY